LSFLACDGKQENSEEPPFAVHGAGARIEMSKLSFQWLRPLKNFLIYGRGVLGRRLRRPLGRRLSSRAVALFLEQIINLLFQWRQIVFDAGPDNIDIHVKIFVDHLVADVAHVKQRQFRVGRDEFRRAFLNLSGGLTNDLKSADHGVLIALALPKGVYALKWLNVLGGARDRLCDVFEGSVSL
jgi:hypothetical protein